MNDESIHRKKEYSLDRKIAAEKLNVSIRTIDRYIREGVLSYRKEQGRVLLNENEINQLIKKREYSKNSFMKMEQIGQPSEEMPKETIGIQKNKLLNKGTREGIFERLYREMRADLKEYQKRLEGANYRVGQLETELKHTIPLMDYYTEKKQLKAQSEEAILSLQHLRIEKDTLIQAKNTLIHSILSTLKIEKLNKWAYMIVLYIFVIAQPILWMIFRKL